MKQKVFSWADSLTIWNENEEVIYTAKGEVFSLGRKLHVCDSAGNEIAFIQQKILSLLPRYLVYLGDDQVAEVVKRVSFTRSKYDIEGLNWKVEGDIWDHDFRLYENGLELAHMSRKWFSWGESYEIEIFEDTNESEILVLIVILAINAVLSDEQAAAASS